MEFFFVLKTMSIPFIIALKNKKYEKRVRTKIRKNNNC